MKFETILETIRKSWVAIGTVLVVLGNFLGLPEGVADIFSPDGLVVFDAVIDGIIRAVGAIIAFYQFAKSRLTKDTVAALHVASKEKRNNMALWYAINPLKSLK